MELCSVSVGKEGPQHTMARTVVQDSDPHAPNIHTRPPAFNPGASAASLSGRQEGCTVCGSLKQDRWGVAGERTPSTPYPPSLTPAELVSVDSRRVRL